MFLTDSFIIVLMAVSSRNSKTPELNLSDDELIKKIIETNSALQFGKLYDRYSQMVYNKCYSFVKSEDEAKDLTQDIFLKLFIQLHKYKAQSKFSTWLYSFTYNFLVNYIKRDQIKKLGERWERLNKKDNYLAAQEDIEDKELFELKTTKLDKALELIEPADKALLLLKYQDEISIKDMQTLLNIKESAVKMRLKRARLKLVEAHKTL